MAVSRSAAEAIRRARRPPVRFGLEQHPQEFRQRRHCRAGLGSSGRALAGRGSHPGLDCRQDAGRDVAAPRIARSRRTAQIGLVKGLVEASSISASSLKMRARARRVPGHRIRKTGEFAHHGQKPGRPRTVRIRSHASSGSVIGFGVTEAPPSSAKPEARPVFQLRGQIFVDARRCVTSASA